MKSFVRIKRFQGEREDITNDKWSRHPAYSRTDGNVETEKFSSN